MASSTVERFDEESKLLMRNFYHTLSEKDQRRYAAVEAKRLGMKASSISRNFLVAPRKPSVGESKNSIRWETIRRQAACAVPEQVEKTSRPTRRSSKI